MAQLSAAVVRVRVRPLWSGVSVEDVGQLSCCQRRPNGTMAEYSTQCVVVSVLWLLVNQTLQITCLKSYWMKLNMRRKLTFSEQKFLKMIKLCGCSEVEIIHLSYRRRSSLSWTFYTSYICLVLAIVFEAVTLVYNVLACDGQVSIMKCRPWFSWDAGHINSITYCLFSSELVNKVLLAMWFIVHWQLTINVEIPAFSCETWRLDAESWTWQIMLQTTTSIK